MNLEPLPAYFAETRDALHQIAYFALAPVRYAAVGRMGLRSTPDGFGTPEFEGQVARVEDDLLVFTKEGNTASRTITTVRNAANFFGRDYEVEWFGDFHDPLEPIDPDRPLRIDVESSRALATWFAYGFDLLGRLRGEGVDASEVQLWPEHFDAATEMGDERSGKRASYGASPGDAEHPEPYLYVSAWGDIDRADPYWNDEAFNGASLSYAELLEAPDPVPRGLEFLLAGYRVLTA